MADHVGRINDEEAFKALINDNEFTFDEDGYNEPLSEDVLKSKKANKSIAIQAFENMYYCPIGSRILLLATRHWTHKEITGKTVIGYGYVAPPGYRFRRNGVKGDWRHRLVLKNIQLLLDETDGLPLLTLQQLNINKKDIKKRFYHDLQGFVDEAINRIDEYLEAEINDVQNIISKHKEGGIRPVVGNRHERNQNARKECIKHKAFCGVCDFDFSKFYGAIGKGKIHVHHINPIAARNESYEVDPINDLIPICPNCHYMIHSQNPPLTVDELKKIIKENGTYTWYKASKRK